MKHLGDITKINGAEIPIVDCITGGSPCQDLSVAGKRAGLSGERSGLFMEQLRIVKEMRKRDQEENGRTNQFIRPRFMVWENVPGAFSSNNGKDFQAVLTEIVRIVEPDAPDVPMPDKGKWTKSGCVYDEMGRWSIAWRVHDAQFWGVPQRRKRIALVADFGGLAAPEVQFERKSVSGYSEPSRETRKGSSGDSKECADRTEQTEQHGVAPLGADMISASGFPLGFRPENVRLYDEKATTVCNGTRPGFTCGIVRPLGADMYNHQVTGDITATLSANSCETATRNGPSVIEPIWGCLGLDHVMLPGGTTYQGRGYYEDVSGCMKTMPHGVMTDE